MNEFIRQMPHPAHFISWRSCAFRLTTFVNGWIVSSVGEWHPKSHEETAPPEPLDSFGSIYETQVFHAYPVPDAPCCGFDADTDNPIIQRRTKTAENAVRNHNELVDHYAAQPNGLIPNPLEQTAQAMKGLLSSDDHPPTKESCDARRP